MGQAVTDPEIQDPHEGTPAVSARRVPGSPTRTELDTSRAIIIFFALGILSSFFTIAAVMFGTVNVAKWRIPTVVARWTSTVEERARASATLARQTAIAVEIQMTEAAVPPAGRTATSRANVLQAEPPADWRLVFSDTFESNENDWPIFSDSNTFTTHRTEIVGGIYRWEARAHRQFVWWVHPDIQQTSDFHMSVEVKKAVGGSAATYGVVFRLNNDSYYRFTISDPAIFAVERYASGHWTAMISRSWSTKIRENDVNLLTVASTGSSFSFFINGQQVGEFEFPDSRLERGFVGLTISLPFRGNRAEFWFDNFELWAPP